MTRAITKFLICGAVDDGKSTLLGKLLYETNQIYKDQLAEIKHESKKYGSMEKKIDFALLTDGLQSEREQGITIDVAYKYFNLQNKKFIVADTPGHAEYTKNMITGASNSDFAVLIVDAIKGISKHTKLCGLIVSLLKLKKIIVAVNKMDLVKYNKQEFLKIKQNLNLFFDQINYSNVNYIPISSLVGDNVITKSIKMKWYKGLTLKEAIKRFQLNKTEENKNLQLGIQLVSRNQSRRVYYGQIFSGEIKIGEKIHITPSNQINFVKSIYFLGNKVKKVKKNNPVSLVLKKNTDISRGSFITNSNMGIKNYSSVLANVFWMDKSIMSSGKKYIIKFIINKCEAEIHYISYKYDQKFQKVKSKELSMNEIGLCKINFNKKIPLTTYSTNKKLGSFVLVDHDTKNTVGAGVIEDLFEEKKDIFWQNFQSANDLKNKDIKKPIVLWFTGLSASGKSTVASLVQSKLNYLNIKNYLLDGDNVRHGLCKDLGFKISDRKENIRRISEVSKLMVDAGLIVLVSFISPFEAERNMARNLFNKNQFIEIFLDTPIKVCEKRDFKGLYKKARAGEIKNFTGISSPYERPSNPEIVLKSKSYTADFLANKVIRYLKEKDFI